MTMDETMERRIARLAEERGRSADSLLEEAVAQYLDREEARLRLDDDLTLAWRAYQADGLHLPAEEADRWLEALERGETKPMPQCRA